MDGLVGMQKMRWDGCSVQVAHRVMVLRERQEEVTVSLEGLKATWSVYELDVPAWVACNDIRIPCGLYYGPTPLPPSLEETLSVHCSKLFFQEMDYWCGGISLCAIHNPPVAPGQRVRMGDSRRPTTWALQIFLFIFLFTIFTCYMMEFLLIRFVIWAFIIVASC